jgi:hypothetical protein
MIAPDAEILAEMRRELLAVVDPASTRSRVV